MAKRDETDAADIKVVVALGDLVDVCKKLVIDEVIFAPEKDDLHELTVLFQDLQDLGLTVRFVIDCLPLRNSTIEFDPLDNSIPMLTYRSVSFNADQMLAKRIIDIVGAASGLLMAGLMLPFIAMAVKLDSPDPLFFGQKRVRENGRLFTCWKFRTMCVDAEAQKEKLLALNEMSGAMFKVNNDPRITRVGSFLRKTSLDELPQFWNVLKGEMSLVGTRPPTPDEVESYENWHHKRISIKPGISGLWQVSGRNEIKEFDDVVRLDLIYIETWTIWLDIKILLKTFLVVLGRRGSC